MRTFEEFIAEMKMYGDELRNDELRNVTYIKALSAAFERLAIEYYNAGENADDRLHRLDDISNAARKISFGEGKQMVRVAGPPCGKGQRLVDGNCI